MFPLWCLYRCCLVHGRGFLLCQDTTNCIRGFSPRCTWSVELNMKLFFASLFSMPLSERGSSYVCVGFSLGTVGVGWMADYRRDGFNISICSLEIWQFGYWWELCSWVFIKQAVLTNVTWPTPILMSWKGLQGRSWYSVVILHSLGFNQQSFSVLDIFYTTADEASDIHVISWHEEVD